MDKLFGQLKIYNENFYMRTEKNSFNTLRYVGLCTRFYSSTLLTAKMGLSYRWKVRWLAVENALLKLAFSLPIVSLL